MIAACRTAGVKLMYAEELCFAPKYVRLKQLVDDGALGKPHLVKQSEKHDGPHAAWFWDVDRSGGGVTMDMGCHAIEFFRWMLRAERKSARGPRASTPRLGTLVHGDKTRGDDDGPDHRRVRQRLRGPGRGKLDQARRHGRPGRGLRLAGRGLRRPAARQLDPHLQPSAATTTPSRRPARPPAGASRSTRRSGTTASRRRWPTSSTACATTRQPIVTGEDGRATLEIIMAAYASAGQGKKIALPFATDAKRPIDLWRGA